MNQLVASIHSSSFQYFLPICRCARSFLCNTHPLANSIPMPMRALVWFIWFFWYCIFWLISTMCNCLLRIFSLFEIFGALVGPFRPKLGPNWAQKWVFGWYLEFGSSDSSDIAYFNWFQQCLTVYCEFLVCSIFLGLLLAHLGPNWAQIGPKNGVSADMSSLVHLVLLILHILIHCNDF